MASAATIVFAREDLSIPGAPESALPSADHADAVQSRFFNLVSDSKPDVIVLDFSGSPHSGTDTILTIRQRSAVPILVVCNPAHPSMEEYQIAGAADCIAAPVDIFTLNQAIQRILRVTGRGRALANQTAVNFTFAGLSFQTQRNVLVAENGTMLALTSSEGRLLAHLLSKPWTLCPRAEIHELLYGSNQVGSRALDVVVSRLRRKLFRPGRSAAQALIKTEFRHGYFLASDVTALPHDVSARP
jgi:two-component system, OmpR family, response regulator AdeR